MPALATRRPLLRNHVEEFRAACAAGLSLPQLVERFGIGRDTVYRWRVAIGLPSAPRGRQPQGGTSRASNATCADCGEPVCWLSPGRAKLKTVRRCRSCATGDVILPTKGCSPTGVLPGPDKVDILAARYAAREYLWNPEDATHE
jgi:hypothetical protein